jgi:hypothetical protein
MADMNTGSFAAKAAKPLEFIKSPEKGTPGVKVLVEIKAGPSSGERIEWIGWLTDKTTQRTGESLTLMGYDGESPESVMKKDFIAVIEKEQYKNTAGEDKERFRVAWINDPSGGGRLDPMNAAEVTGAKERLKAAMTAAKAKASKPTNAEDEPRF